MALGALVLAPTDATPAAAAPPTGVVPPAIRDRYLTTRPRLGPVTVVDVSGESNDRKLLAATLQGIVNRSVARIYLVGARAAAEDQHWLDVYQSQGLISVRETIGLDAALHEFAGELGGYVLADAAEPWTINTATSVAGATGSVVATPATEAAVQAEGLTKVADHRGRWSDAATAYEATAKAYRSKLAYQGLAIEQPDRNQPRDLFVQQGILVVYTRPSQPDFDRVYDLLETYPATHPVYGYVSDTGDEEVTAVVRLARTGHFLVPTDTTDNLSFHLAVGVLTRALPADPAGARPQVEPCTTSTVNVVLSFSDGDNLVVPEARFASGDNWGSSRRGDLPIGWGLSPAAAVLMPAIWDRYVDDASRSDEVVDMMGLGYSFPSLMPDGATFWADSMRLRSALGIRSTWSLDALISKPDAGGWAAVGAAVRLAGSPPDGILLNYQRWPGPAWYHSSAGVPVITSRQDAYDDGPADIAAQVQALLDQAPADRPLVSLIPATVWQSSYDALADALLPLADRGVRFLTPAQAFACLPAPPATTTTTTSPPTTAAQVDDPTAPPAAPVAGNASYTG